MEQETDSTVISIDRAQQLSNSILKKWGFSLAEAKWITHNMLAAELAGKSTHGFTRLQFIQKFLLPKVNLNARSKVISQSSSHLYIDANYKLGFEPIYTSLHKAFKKLKKSALVAVGVKDCLFSGYVGDYAYEAVMNGYIYMGFHNSTAALIPHGASEPLWGTNPITVGIPSKDIPIIYDAAMSQISGGQVLLSQKKGLELPSEVAMDNEGNITTDPFKSVGLLSHGHKGSGLAYVVELLAGALTASKLGKCVEGGWGSFSILINPEMFRPLIDFKEEVELSRQELKQARKAKDTKEIFSPGEQSWIHRRKAEKLGKIIISTPVYHELMQFSQE